MGTAPTHLQPYSKYNTATLRKPLIKTVNCVNGWGQDPRFVLCVPSSPVVAELGGPDQQSSTVVGPLVGPRKGSLRNCKLLRPFKSIRLSMPCQCIKSCSHAPQILDQSLSNWPMHLTFCQIYPVLLKLCTQLMISLLVQVFLPNSSPSAASTTLPWEERKCSQSH